MVKSCCAYNCKQRYVKGSNITFHSFPKNEEIKAVWLQKLRRKDFTPTQNSVLCSKHFEPSCFDNNRFGGTWLKPLAIPTIFDYTVKRPHIKKPHPKKQLLPDISIPKEEPLIEDYKNNLPFITQLKEGMPDIYNTPPPSSIIEPELTITVVNRHPVHMSPHENAFCESDPMISPDLLYDQCRSVEDYTVEDMNIAEKAKRVLNLAKNKIKNQRQKIVRISKKLKKSEQNVVFLTSLVHELQKSKIISDLNRNEACDWSPHFLDPSVSIKRIKDC